MKQKTYARVVDNTAHELFTPPDGHTLTECFHKDVAAQFVEVPAGTAAGAKFDGKKWSNPPAPVADPAQAHYYASVPALNFYRAFAPAERIAIKASTDAHVLEFWEFLQLALAAHATIDPNLPSTCDALKRMRSAGALTSDERIEQIKKGEPR